MENINDSLFKHVKNALRITHNELDDEIKLNIRAGLDDLNLLGAVEKSDISDENSLIVQAVTLYVKSFLGLDNDTEKNLVIFEQMKNKLSIYSQYKGE